ncbi:MAG: hypothetical protein J6U60_01710, partial [Clostridia bacterium]|nr:hypothetical protein [Clostridia bacterium]
GENGVDGQSAYALYCQAYPEYQGTLEEWLADLHGENGVGIDSIVFDEDGNLLISFSDGAKQTLTIPEKQ